MSLEARERTEISYLRVRYPQPIRQTLAEAQKLWESFCLELSPREKQRFGYSGDTMISGVGYEYKDDPKFASDRKENLHVRPADADYVREQARRIDQDTIRLVESVLELAEQMQDFVCEYAGMMEEQYRMPGLQGDTRANANRLLIRFLHYFGGCAPGDLLATPHPDKGAFTPHLYESHPGLQYLDENRSWKPVTFSELETAVIPAMRMQYRSECAVTAVYHRVVATDETARTGRFSAVCFADFANTPYYDKERYGRLQDMPVGFNYGSPFFEFKKYFKL